MINKSLEIQRSEKHHSIFIQYTVTFSDGQNYKKTGDRNSNIETHLNMKLKILNKAIKQSK